VHPCLFHCQVMTLGKLFTYVPLVLVKDWWGCIDEKVTGNLAVSNGNLLLCLWLSHFCLEMGSAAAFNAIIECGTSLPLPFSVYDCIVMCNRV